MRALVLLPYFNRPKMVRGALSSLLTQGDDWTLHFIDDGSERPGAPVVREVLGACRAAQVECVLISDTVEDKVAQGGSRHGAYMNARIQSGTEDIVICLCDDDALVEGAIPALLEWFAAHPDAAWSYSHVSVYDPRKEAVPLGRRSPRHPMNRFRGSVVPAFALDSSQITFRRSMMILYESPQTVNLDASMFQKMYEKYGPCPFNGVVSQYKGIYSSQMGFRACRGETYDAVDLL